jgi:hypothetical protein
MPGQAHQPFQEIADEFDARVDACWREVERPRPTRPTTRKDRSRWPTHPQTTSARASAAIGDLY